MTPEKTEILMPFIGAFSSGKSSLINALLGEALLSTDISPETALPMELRAAKNLGFIACTPDGKQQALTKERFLGAEFNDIAQTNGWICAQLPHLAAWPNLVLVDLPGWSSGHSEHERHVDDYLLRLARSHLDKDTVFVIAISADEGTLRDNVRERLQTIDMNGSRYLLVLTKSDKRSPSDLEKITQHLTEAVTAVMGKAPTEVLMTSARKKDIEPLKKAIQTIQKSSEPKAPAVNIPELAAAIDRHLDALKKLSSNSYDKGIYIFDELWDYVTGSMLESYFGCIPHPSAKLRGDSFLNSLGVQYYKIAKINIDKNLPAPSKLILESLEKLNISIPSTDTFDSNESELLNKYLKYYMETAIKKSKPGIFSSSDPEAVGSSIQSNINYLDNKFRGTIIYCAQNFLSNGLEKQIESWRAVRKLLAANSA